MKTIQGMVIGALGVLVVSAAWGQTKGWDRRFGGSMDESCSSVATAPAGDGGFLLFGSSSSGPDGDHTESNRGQEDFWCVKISVFGDKIWDKRFGGADRDFGSVAVATRDGGYILGGTTGSGAGGDKTQGSRGGWDSWIVKIGATGSKQWDRTYGGAGIEELAALIQTRDGGYLVACNSSSGAGGDRTQSSRGDVDYWIVKTDSAGRKQWDKRFGGNGADICADAIQTRDGGYLLGGQSDSGAGGDKSQGSRGGEDYWIVKLDAAGRKQWDKRFGGAGGDFLFSVAQALDGGYLLGGYSRSGASGDKTAAPLGNDDIWIVKTSATGAKQWDVACGGAGDDGLGMILPTADGGGLIAGDSDSPVGGDLTQAPRGGEDFLAVKLSAAGTKQWVRRYGGSANDNARAVCRTVDGSYLLAGSTSSGAGFDKTEDSRGDRDFWAVKVLVPDAYEADNAMAAARSIRNGDLQLRNIHQIGNDDWAKFTIGAGGARDVEIISTFDTQLWLFRNRDGALVGYDDPDAFGSPSIIALAALDPGTYAIVVSETGSDAILPYYQLSARWTQIVLPDRYESDNRRSAAKRIRNGRTQNRTIHRAGNRDWAKFTIGAAGARNLKVETRGASGDDTQMGIYNSAGRRLFYDDDSGRGRFSRIRVPTLGAGTYFIRVQENGNNDRIQAYTLRATWTAR
jgi:hypothetical protein